jgi:hypothetical protein
MCIEGVETEAHIPHTFALGKVVRSRLFKEPMKKRKKIQFRVIGLGTEI